MLLMNREKTSQEFKNAATRILEDYHWRRENRETRVLYTGQRCRSEFVMRDFEGWPEFAVEYNGGYHEGSQQSGRDEFKRLILNEVGLPLKVMGQQDLQVADVD